MNSGDLTLLLDRLLAQAGEHEWLEFKHNDDPHTIGEYVSALANAAALDGEPFGYMVWGIENDTRRVVGTRFKPGSANVGAQILDLWLHQYLRPKLDFRFDAFDYQGQPVVMLRVPAAVAQPVSFHEVEYIRIHSAKVKLASHADKEARLWARLNTRADWSAELVSTATVADLDASALAVGRQRFAEKHPHLAGEVAGWDVPTLLSKLKLSRGGQLTRAALLLFGKDESAQFLPLPPQVSWVLKDADGTVLDYQHYGLPLLLVPDALFARVRNLTVRYLPGKVECLLTQDQSPEQYRNPCLTQAMVALKLIDTVGSGIRRMFIEQRKRFFPLPDYVIEPEQQRVEVRITGRILGEQYTHALMQQPDLSLMDVFLLDKVQKRLPISAEDARALRARKLIEGRTPNIHVSAKVAQVMGGQAQHTLNKGLDSAYYRELVLQHLRNFTACKRDELEAVMRAKLPDVLSDAQKRNRVKNLLADLSRRNLITPERKGPGARWRLVPQK